MNRNNIYTVNPLYNGSTTQATGDDSVQSGGTTIIYQQGSGTGLTDAQKQKLDGIQEGAEVNQNAYSKVRLNGSDTLIIEAKNKTDILNMSGVYPIAIAINGSGGLDFTVSSDQTNTNAVVTQSQLQAAIEKLQEDKYWKVDEDGKLYTELDVYSHKEISAYGAGTGGGSTGGAGALYECADVLRDGDKVQGAAVGSILSYNGSHWYAIPQSAITPDLTNYATKSYVTQQINDLIGGAPGTLDTLKEIAEALGNNPNFATTVTEMINNIGLRVDQVEDRVVSLEDMFEWDKSASASDPSLWRIKAKKDLYGVGEISAYGYSSGTVPTGAQYMYELKDVLFTELTSGQLLQWNGTKWINIDKNAVGLNETELAKYLTNNNYAKKSDITWANLLNKPTTWGWASITGKPTTLAGYGITDGVPNTRRVSAGSGLAGGGVLSSDVTISLGTIGTAGTYTKITTDMYGRVVSGTTLSEGDIPTLQISKISGLQSALNSKLNISDFNTWFTIKKDSQGRIVSIQANYDFFSVGEISAYGYSSGTVPTGAQYMYELKDVLFTELTSGQLLQWNGTKWINIDKNAVGLNETELAKYLTNNNYAKKSDITWANLLNKPTTWGWASITGKPTTLAGYGITDGVPNTRRVSAGSGLAGGGVLSSDVTISLGTIGTAGTYTKITTDMYGRVVSGTTLSEGDIPTLQISKISGLQSALNSKLNISDFNTWFTIKKDSQGRIVSIQANYDFFSVGEISAYGLGETQPSVTTLAGLDDVTITSPANGQTLIYDSATSQWKNGTIIGGGNISLNGTVYKPVNGTITLPNLATPGDITTALNGYATQTWVTDKNYATQSWVNGKGYVTATALATMGLATQAWVNSQGFLKSNSLDNYVTLNTIQNITAAKTFQGGIVSTTFRKSDGTSSQFLKADGSVDGNLYALAYNGNQNKVQYSRYADYTRTIDRRNQTYTPFDIENSTLSAYFTIRDTPYSNWRSTISVKGWSSDYATWELTGPSHNDDTKTNERLYYRYGFNTTWNPYKAIAFIDDVKNLGEAYFNGQNIYSDYGHWVVGLVRIGTADIGDKYISGEMIYRRSNGIYANGSVRFNLIKKYQTTSMFAGVLYVGYGINTDQDAPRLCTFTYQGVKWGGLCWRSAASLNSIKTIIYDNSSTDTPFYVKYFNSQSSEVQNAEINNSISVLGSDIDIFPISSNGKFYTSSGRMDIHSAGNDWAYMRYTTDGRFYDIGLSSSRNSGSAMNGETGNFEIRPNGSSSNGIFVRYSNSSYGRLGVVSRSTQECSISYWNNAPTSNYPLWTVGAGIRNQYSFDWYYHNQGYKATLDSEGKLFVNVRVAGNPYCSLTIGDYDTGLSWVSDGVIGFRSNAKDVGFWGYTNGRLFNCYFREPSGVTYEKASLTINGNGSTISPSIGFHQPGVVGCHLELDNGGNFRFKDSSGYRNVYAGNLIADAGFLYSRYNGIEIKIGAENGSYVHFVTNPARSLYFDNSLFISGGVLPYTTSTHDLGDAGHIWRNIYANRLIGQADKSVFLVPNCIGGQQPNPQTYFNNITGLKVAMTGVYTNGAYWSDTLWINGYHGDDVPKCTALHFPRDGSAEMYISSQEAKSTSYGAVYRIWSSRNSNKNDASWVCSTLNARDQILAGSYIQALGGVNCAGVINSGGCSGFNVYATFHGNGDHGGIEIAASDNVLGIGVHKNNAWYMWWTNSGSIGSSSNKSYIFSYNGSSWNFTGSVVASGEVTAYSDVRLKSNIQPLKYRGRLTPKTYIKDNKQSIGFIAQEVQILYPETVLMSDDKEHYLSLNYNALTAVLAAQLNDVDDEVTLLKKRVEFLEKEVKRLSE